MVKDIDEQLMTMADEKINYEQLKRSPVSTYLLKLDQYSRRLAQDIKLSKEADVKVKGKRR